VDENKERENIQVECLRLNKCLARVRASSMPTDEVTITRKALQLGQALIFCRFISAIAENYFSLISETEKAEEIGVEGIKQIHNFLKEYTDLWEEEYNWYR